MSDVHKTYRILLIYGHEKLLFKTLSQICPSVIENTDGLSCQHCNDALLLVLFKHQIKVHHFME